MSSPFISVKVTYEDDIRRFEMEGCSYKELLEQIRQVFALKNSTTVVIKYKDNEGDLVTIATDSELECALKNQLHDNLLRLSLFRKPKVTKASHAAVATTEDAPAASVPSSEVTASTREDKMKKWKEMMEQKKKMREEMKQMKRKFRDELKMMSDDSSSDEEKKCKVKDPKDMKALIEQRRKMWQDMRKRKGDCMSSHCMMWRKFRKELEDSDSSSSSDEEKKCKVKHDPQAMKALMEQRRKMWQDMKELKRKARESCKKKSAVECQTLTPVTSTAPSAATCEDWMSKWKEMKEKKKKMREEMKEMRRKFRKELENSSDDSENSSDEDKSKTLMAHRWKMWQNMKQLHKKQREE